MGEFTLERINIALAADNNYAQHVAVVIASVMKNIKSGSQVRFFLLSDGIAREMLERIDATAASLQAELSVIDLSTAGGFETLYTSGHISRAAYFRLTLPDILPADVRKIIYCDVDLLVLGDITELWNYDLQGLPLAAVADYGIMASKRLMKQKHSVIGLPMDFKYFNSGVLVIDVDAWREKGYAKDVIELAASGNLPHHDQDALNKVFMEKWHELPLRWNVIPPVVDLLPKILFNSRFRDGAVVARRSAAILHYAGRYKPWEFACTQGFNEQYYAYLAATAFAAEPMPKPGKNMKGKSLTRQLLRIKLANFISDRL